MRPESFNPPTFSRRAALSWMLGAAAAGATMGISSFQGYLVDNLMKKAAA